MPEDRFDVGFTHIALPVTNMDASIAFYSKYADMRVIHRRGHDRPDETDVAWLSDLTRRFAIVLAESKQVLHPLGPFAHMGVACVSRAEVDRRCEMARADGCLRDEPCDTGGPAGYYANLTDPDGHTLELTYGQEVDVAVDAAGDQPPDGTSE